ncbi:DUF2809 domain-containing protein [uncultured Formosa sp.]|uniref:ribosomal maturation YjgA family protein n=1 Tax=uncultured Formosa sp. TaxID=255435 RepID=UPI0026368F02|nr:DUF2809 domain-containing protein [uncultured Formosa sp.]
MTFNLKYFIAFVLLLCTELLIATTSGFIRHTFGDFLAVIGVYVLVKSVFHIEPITLGIGVLVFSFMIETLQLTPFLELTGLYKSRIARIVFGSTFSFGDLLAYTLGVFTIIIIDTTLGKKYKLPVIKRDKIII